MAGILALAPIAPDEVVRDWLAIERVDVAGRRPIRCDAVLAKHLLVRDAPPPAAGESLRGELGKESAWRAVRASEAGDVGEGAAWAYAAVESPERRVVLAQLAGATTLYVNGTPHVGDAYRYGFGGVPVVLRAGRNDVYVTGTRGSFSLRLRAPAGPLHVADWDATLPDGTAGAGAVLVMNATERPIELARPTKLRLAPLQATKVPFELDLGPREPGEHPIEVPVVASSPELSATARLRTSASGAVRRATFRSGIDGSVQEYAVLPPAESDPPAAARGLVLTLHGAGVDARGHAASYAAKPDFWIVAPTNRRPYGFDWQDWGRLDAYEVLELALAASGLGSPPVFLTGHSMGGHGTWHLAANDPDRFAAIAPSAGWISFDSYGGRPKGALADVWHRADGASRTLDLVSNLARTPVYLLHGGADETVPASEARDGLRALGGADGLLRAIHVEEGAGHWWDDSEAPGVGCVDWPAIFDAFRRATGSAEPDDAIDWTSVGPGVDSTHRWVHVAQAIEDGEGFRVGGRRDTDRGVDLRTRNVRRLRVDLRERDRLVLDGEAVERSASGWYARTSEGWRTADAGAPPGEKSPDLCGPFKRAFDRRFLFVVGTKGDDVEDRELLDLARYLADTWWYRGNGTVEILEDAAFVAGDVRKEARNAILFGNEDTNAAWKIVVPATCPVRARRGSIAVRGEAHEGADLACLFVQPRSDVAALVGVLADSGPAGARLLATVPVFTSGVGLPDFTLFDRRVLELGDGGVIAAGWFDHAWR